MVDGTLTINSTSADATSVVTIKTGAVDAENDVEVDALVEAADAVVAVLE